MLKFAVMASGGGTDFQSLIDAVEAGQISAEICCLIAGKPGIYAITRAQDAGIPVAVVQKKSFDSMERFDEAILKTLQEFGADFVVLAGYLSIIGEKTLAAYPNKIINVHPSLIPSFCGMGMYGSKVHEAAIAYGVKFSGATVHFIDGQADTGPIIMQAVVPVSEGDTPQDLAARVLETEHKILPQAVALMAEGKLETEGRIVKILK
ncbi:phosphoribosylglycinamide formyltransferase [Christensenella timonensis]|uniref:phosphoribosylglycinamide formyltransferase n=1 Tax=Christensenella timonensis TaxID=1816678 RepID=UPI000830FB5D|nr:phosphoribosylglycinamide formyltransferase [Christensenella timonensis]